MHKKDRVQIPIVIFTSLLIIFNPLMSRGTPCEKVSPFSELKKVDVNKCTEGECPEGKVCQFEGETLANRRCECVWSCPTINTKGSECPECDCSAGSCHPGNDDATPKIFEGFCTVSDEVEDGCQCRPACGEGCYDRGGYHCRFGYCPPGGYGEVRKCENIFDKYTKKVTGCECKPEATPKPEEE